MASTVFTDYVTPIVAAWLNDVNAATYNGLTPTQATQARYLAAGVVVLSTGQGNAATNTATAQAALTAGGDIYFVIPGTFYINATLITYSNSRIYVGAGVTLKMVDGGTGGIFRNYAGNLLKAQGADVAIGAASWVGAPDLINYAILCTGLPSGTVAKYPLGSYVSVVCMGHGTLGSLGVAQNTRGYRGVWKVVATTDTTLTYEIRFAYPGGNTNQAVMKIYPADVNIKYFGPGTLDGNLAGISRLVGFDGDPKSNIIWTRNAKDVTIDGLNFAPGITWTIGSNYVRDYCVRNVTGDLRGYHSLDGVHLSGQHQQVLLENLYMYSTDNIIGCTIDCTEGTVNDYELQQPGDMYDVTGRNIWGHSIGATESGTVTAAICAIYGPDAYTYHNMTFDNIYGTGSSAFQLSTYPNTNMFNCNGDKLRVTNLHATCNGPQMNLTPGATAGSKITWDNIVVDDIVCSDVAGAPAFKTSNTNAGGLIKQLTIKNVFYSAIDAITAATGPLIDLGGLAINNIDVMDCENANLGSGVPFARHYGSALLGRVSFKNVSVISAGGANSGLYAVTGTGSCNSTVFDNCSFTGAASLGSIFSINTTSTYYNVYLNNCTVSGAQAAYVNANNGVAANVFMNNLTISTGATSAYAGVFGGPTNLFVNGYVERSAPTNNPFQCVTAGVAYNFRFENMSRDTDQITKTAGNLRLHGTTARTDGNSVNAPAIGDSFYNTNAAFGTGTGFYGRTSGAAWLKVF